MENKDRAHTTHEKIMNELEQDLKQAQATADRRRELLKNLEYVVMDEGGIPYCPECGYKKGDGHWKDCKLGKELAGE